MPQRQTPPNLPPIPDVLPPFPTVPPLDAPLVELVGWWIEARCECGQAASLPARLMAAQHGWNTPLRELLRRLSCARCGSRAPRLRLIENPATVERGQGGGAACKTLEL